MLIPCDPSGHITGHIPGFGMEIRVYLHQSMDLENDLKRYSETAVGKTIAQLCKLREETTVSPF